MERQKQRNIDTYRVERTRQKDLEGKTYRWTDKERKIDRKIEGIRKRKNRDRQRLPDRLIDRDRKTDSHQ